MTLWRNENDERYFKSRLGSDVYNFLNKDSKIIDYLYDHLYVVRNLNSQIKNFQLTDNSMFVLPICKVFEGFLYLLAREKGWFSQFSSDNEPDSIRWFYKNNRKAIEAQIEGCNSLTSERKQAIKDKLFSTIEDFTHRHTAVHFRGKLEAAEVDNYEAILTKVKELAEMFVK